MRATSVFGRNAVAYAAGARVVANKGSTRSSKTYSILQLLYLIARGSTEPLVISVVSESLPHLKKGAIRQLREMLEAEGLWSDRDFNKTDQILRVGKSIIEFFSVDSPGKAHGPARDILFVNECINISYTVYTQLAIRTKRTIFLDYNPCHAFWLHDKVLPQRDALDIVEIHSTYKDNEYLTPAQVADIESRRGDSDWWNVYGLGVEGNRQGLVFPRFEIVPAMPAAAKRRYLGLDFGFVNDPTALVEVALSEGALWLDERLYATGLSNEDIARAMREQGLAATTTVADSAEPKSIAALRRDRLRVEPARKGADSVLYGITLLRGYEIKVTQRSVNLIKELRNYKWKQDRDGNQLNVPNDNWNHGLDAVRYVVINKFAPDKPPAKGVASARLIPT